MNEEEKHLSIEQIEKLVGAEQAVVEGCAFDPSIAVLQSHLEICEACRLRASAYGEAEKSLGLLRVQFPGSSGEQCLPERSLFEVASGTAGQEEVEVVLDHVVQCDFCSLRFRAVSDCFGNSIERDEVASLAALRSSTPQWQANLGRQLGDLQSGKTQESRARVPNRRQDTQTRGWNRRWVFGATALTLGSIVVGIVLLSSRTPPIERLLGDAYAEDRTLEIRIPEARYAQPRASRGTTKSRLDRPKLLSAEATITQKLANTPTNARWLQARGRAELLEGNPDAALESFEGARDTQPDLPFLLTDLGAAYFQRGVHGGSEAHYGTAIEYFSKALAKNSNDQTALFNRAITLEKIHLFTPAIQDWESYLRLYPGTEWSKEAEERLAKLREQLKSSELRLRDPVLTPGELKLQEKKDSGAIRAEVDRHIEAYLEAATGKWVKNHREVDSPALDQELGNAIRVVAEVAKKNHADTWLADLLEDLTSPRVQDGLRTLERAIESNATGDFSRGRQEAKAARNQFRRGHSRAGELRARLEEIYSLKLSNQGKKCLMAAGEMERLSKGQQYSWLAIRLGVEKGDCLSLTGDLGGGLSALLASQKAAEQAGYPTLYLRASAFIADIEVEDGDEWAGWKTASGGLKAYWAGSYPPMRAYNLYASMDELADISHQWHLQTLVWYQAIATIVSEENNLLKAMAYSRLGTAALMAGSADESAAAFGRARELLAASPQNEVTRSREIDVEVWLARAEARRVSPGEATEQLKAMEPEIEQVSSHYVLLDFYLALGEVEARRGQFRDAEVVLEKCICVSEKALRSLRSEEERVRWSRTAADCYRSSVELKLRQGNVAAALELWEWYLAAPLRSASETQKARNVAKGGREPERNGGVPELQEVARRRSSLKSQARIVYALLPNGLGIWIYDDLELRGKWIPLESDELKRKAKAFAELCADSTSSVELLKERGGVLYDVLLESISVWLPNDRVWVIEADESLVAVPLEAMVDHQGRYLAENHTFVWSPGLYYSNWRDPYEQLASTDPVLIVASPAATQFNEETLEYLPNALAEGQSVAHRFPNSRLIVGQSATVRNVIRELKNAALFHYAGHAATDSKHPGLVLASDSGDGHLGSLLTAAAVQQMQLHDTRVAVLAACSTQKGSQGGAFDPDSLARAFVRAGVRDVLSSRWNVDSIATSQLLDRFYEQLRENNSVSRSLRNAEDAIRARQETAHPFYWAAFTVIGDA